jgi:hypothetical protein
MELDAGSGFDQRFRLLQASSSALASDSNSRFPLVRKPSLYSLLKCATSLRARIS